MQQGGGDSPIQREHQTDSRRNEVDERESRMELKLLSKFPNELINRERLDRIQEAVASPVVVLEQVVDGILNH